MRKMNILFLIILILINLLFPFNQIFAQNNSNYNCNWTILNNANSPYNGHLAFCTGGFSKDEVPGMSVSLYCDNSNLANFCGGIIPQSKQKYTFDASTQIQQGSDGSYYTCLTGDFDESIKTAVDSMIRSYYVGCIPLAIGGLITAIGTGGFALPIALTTSAACYQLFSGAKSISPNLNGNLKDKNGKLLCSNTKTLNLDLTIKDPTDYEKSHATVTQICSFAGKNQPDCDTCMNKTNDPGVYTPFGCIKTNPQKFVTNILQIAMGLAGGIAFLMILYGGLTIMMSSGNPEKLNGGKEIITSAISGLLLIVFSVVILKIIGVDIFKIPGLT